MSKIIFECNFCKSHFNKQIDLNAHLLFIHFFENPECSLDTPHIIEDYFYSKDKFMFCISCGRNRYTEMWDYTYRKGTNNKYITREYNTKQITNLRSMENYFCEHCLFHSAKTEEAAIKEDLEQSEAYGRKNNNYYLVKFRRFKRRQDGIWQYLQSITKNKIRMYEKTLTRIHSTNLKLEGVLKSK